MVGIKDIFKPEDELSKLAREKGISIEDAWSLQQDRKERDTVSQAWKKGIQQETELQKRDSLLQQYNVFYQENGRVRVSCPRLAKLIMNDDNNHYLVMKDNKEILWYNGSYYELNGERRIEQRINYYLDDVMTNKYRQEVLTFITTYEHTDRNELEPPLNLINLKNGIYNIETKKLIKHDPKYKFLNHIPINYEPKAKIKEIKKFLENTIDVNDIKLIQEFLGDCLQRSYSFKRAIMCVGERDTGKSQLLNLVDLFLGEGNTSNISLFELCVDKFSSVELYRKYANVCSELDPQEIDHVEKFLSLTGGDWQSGQRKFQDRFKFKSYAKLIFACNKIPDVKNKNPAFYVRWIVIVFSNQVPFEDQIEDYYKTLATEKEMSGLLNWALAGLQRLKEQHGYTEHRSLEDVQDLMQKGSNPIREFVDQYIVVDSTGKVKKEDLYLSYVEFCKNMGYPFKADSVFSRFFKPYLKYGAILTEEKPRKGGRKPIWKGIICTFSRIGDLATLDKFTTEEQQKE